MLMLPVGIIEVVVVYVGIAILYLSSLLFWCGTIPSTLEFPE